MPEIGEIRKANEIGYGGNRNYFIWHACEDCKKERWVHSVKGRPVNKKCRICGNKGKNLISGRNYGSRGYPRVWISPDDFFAPMAKKDGYIDEHRLVMAKHLGRCLHSWEIVHHKNHIKSDNRIENLQLVTEDRHTQITILERKIDRLGKRVTLLEAENILLKEQIKEQVRI